MRVTLYYSNMLRRWTEGVRMLRWHVPSALLPSVLRRRLGVRKPAAPGLRLHLHRRRGPSTRAMRVPVALCGLVQTRRTTPHGKRSGVQMRHLAQDRGPFGPRELAVRPTMSPIEERIRFRYGGRMIGRGRSHDSVECPSALDCASVITQCCITGNEAPVSVSFRFPPVRDLLL